MRKLLTFVLSVTIGMTLFSQNSHPKYGDSGTPEVRLPQTLTSTNTRDAEEYIVYLVDSYGDGWNGASFDLSVNGTVVLDDATVASGSEAIYYVSLDNGDEVATTWTEGSWDSECAYGLYNHYGVLVAQAGTDVNPDLEFTYTVVHTEISNGNFDDYTDAGNGWQNFADGWSIYPDWDPRYSVVPDGDGIYGSDATFSGYDGYAAKMWTHDWEGAENNLTQSWDNAFYAGAEFNVSGMAWQHPDDAIQEGSKFELIAKYFGDGGESGEWWNDYLGDDRSEAITSESAYETWHALSLNATVPAGTFKVEVGAMLTTGANAGGAVYFDAIDMSPGHSDAGGCNYTEYIITCDGGSYQSEVGWEILNTAGEVMASGGAPITVEDGVTACLADGSYGVLMYDSYGDGWNGNVLQLWTLDADGNPVEQFAGELETGSYGAGQHDVGDGPFDDLLGCTDPAASNTDEGALWDDGSCSYEGTDCGSAFAAEVGTNTANGAPVWYTFTASVSGVATVSSDGSGVDTQVYGYSGTCDDLTQVGFGDDEGEAFASIMSFAITAGTTYYLHWTDYWSSEGFDWTLFEEPLATTPTGMMALGGLGRVYLSFNPFNPANLGGSVAAGDASMNIEQHVQQRIDKSNARIENEAAWQGKTLEEVQAHVATLDFPQHRDTDVYITLYDSYGDGHDGDAYLMVEDTDGTYDMMFGEVAYDVVETLAGGWTGYESAYGPFTLADGLYWIGWNPDASYLGEQSYVATDADGSQLGAGEYGTGVPNCFETGDTDVECPAPAIADLTMLDADGDGIADATYEPWTGRFTVTVKNIGSAQSNYFYTMVHSAYPDTTNIYPPTYFQYMWEGLGLAAGEEKTYGMDYYLTVPGLTGGYDGLDYQFYVMADSYGDYCVEPGGNYNNVLPLQVINNTSPLAESSWNVYRGDDGGDASLLLNLTSPDWQPGMNLQHTDETATAEHTYCYTATQVNSGVESGHSSESCAYSSLPPEVPAPTNVSGSSSGFDVTLTWDAPPPYEGAWGLGLGTPSRTRQGGDTVDDATVVTDLLGESPLTGTTVGYTDDYDVECGAGSGTSPDVVYSFTPSTDMAANISTCYSSYDTKIFVYENEAGTLAATTTGGVACSDDAAHPEYTDCTAWTSYIEGVSMSAGNTYYIVMDGWSYSEGDYEIEITPYNPLAGYTIVGPDGPVGSAAPTATEWNTVLFAAEPTDLELSIQADYAIPGIIDIVSSELVGPVTVTVQLEDNPSNLMAMDYGDDVHLMWDPPIDASNMDLKYHDGIQGNATYYAGAAAVRFRVVGSWAMKGTAQGIWMDSWPDANYGDAQWRITVVPPNEDGWPDMNNILYDNEEVSVDADPTSETYGWAITEFDPIAVTGDVFVIYSGFYNFEEGTYNYPGDDFDLDMMQCDPTMDFPGSNYHINGDPFDPDGQDLWTMGQVFSWCGDWQMNVAADFSGGGAVLSNWIGADGYASSDLPSMDNVERVNTKENYVEYTAPSTPSPYQAQMDRDMLGFNVYRAPEGGEAEVVGMADPNVFEYWDGGLDWGTYTYHVTTLFDDHESIPTNEVTVTLSNVAPNPVTIIAPSDGLEVNVDSDNLDEEVAFIWTAASDDDNDALEYLMSLADPETEEIWGIIPDDQIANGGYEDGIEDWYAYPEDNGSWAIAVTGENIYGSDAVFEAYDGDNALKMWGQYNEDGAENYGSFGQWYTVGEHGINEGSEVRLDAMIMSHADDFIGQGGNLGYLAFYWYDDSYNMVGEGWEMSQTIGAGSPSSEWLEMGLSAIVPDGCTMVWAGVEMYQPSNDDHGSMYIDEVYMYAPITQTGIFLPYGEIAMGAIEDSVNEMTIAWDIWSFDGFEATPSSGGARMLHLNISEDLVGVDGGIAAPKEFALHNNYPNPFNPVTNITYDIAQNSEVTLEIYNVMGQRVRTLAQGSHEPGRYRIMWNATNDYGQALSSGMYIYRIQAGDFVSVKKLILMK